MFKFFKQLKQLKEENERLKMRCRVSEMVSDNYCGWVFAYRNAVAESYRDGSLTAEQADMLFERSRNYYKYWQAT